ncbi:MAG: response regulator [Vulcanimicrobiota bacterium]
MSRILLIEDEDSLARGLVDVLRVKGYVVERAAEGNEGLTRALGEGYDLILLDIELPGLSGLEILRELRTQGNTSRVLMLTSRASEMDKVLGFELGVDDYLGALLAGEGEMGVDSLLLRRLGGTRPASTLKQKIRSLPLQPRNLDFEQ